MSKLIWIASYPKSGNTWFRVFLANYLEKGQAPVDINKINFPNFSDRQWWDDALGWHSSDFTEESIFSTRLDVQDAIARSGKDGFQVFKTHDAYLHPLSKKSLFSREATRCAIYIVRNPLDVALSYSNHVNKSVDVAIQKLNDMNARMADNSNGLRPQLSQFLGTWSWHVSSWCDAKDIKVHVMRYEDMLLSPETAFSEACKFIGLKVDRQKLLKALDDSRFDALKQQEEAAGFREKPRQCERFFNEGRAGRWRDVLHPFQIESIVQAHTKTMEAYGYPTTDCVTK